MAAGAVPDSFKRGRSNSEELKLVSLHLPDVRTQECLRALHVEHLPGGQAALLTKLLHLFIMRSHASRTLLVGIAFVTEDHTMVFG